MREQLLGISSQLRTNNAGINVDLSDTGVRAGLKRTLHEDYDEDSGNETFYCAILDGIGCRYL